MKINKILDYLQDPKLVEFILKEINLIQKLPESGILAGQAVSSMIYKYLKLDLNPVINDLDIFFVFNYHSVQGVNNNVSLMSNQVREYFYEQQKNKNSKFSGINALFMFNDYGQLKINTGKKYDILGTTTFKKINKVFITNQSATTSYSRDSLIYDIIDSFDINCTQVAIDLRSKKIYFTEAFILFLSTKQMEIVKYNTPVHSLIRLIRKNKEIGSFINLEEEKMLVGNMISTNHDLLNLTNKYKSLFETEKEIFESQYSSVKNRNLCKIHDMRDKNIHIETYFNTNTHYVTSSGLSFGKKHLKQFLSVKDKLSEFELCHFISPYNKDKRDNDINWLSELKEERELNTLIVENKHALNLKEEYFKQMKNFNPYKNNLSLFRKYLDKTECLVFDFNKHEQDNCIDYNISNTPAHIYSLPLTYKSCKKTKTSTIHFINKYLDNNEELEDNGKYSIKKILNFMLSKNFVDIELNQNINLNVIKSFIKKLKKHSEINDFIFTIKNYKDLEYVNNVLSELEKEYGSLLYGFLNKKYLKPEHFDIQTLKKQIDFSISIKNEILKDRLIDIDNEKHSIKELVTGNELSIEGSEMGHCVGGYTYSIKGGSSIIIALKNKVLNKRMTIELNPVKKNGFNKFRIVQLQAKYNQPCSYEEAFDILSEINKVYPLIGFETKFEKTNVFRKNNYQNINRNEGNIPEINFDDNDMPF